MITDLKVIIYEEKNIISKMVELLKEQFDYIVEKDLENLNRLNPKLEDISRELASIEIKRRQLFGDDISMSEVVENSNDGYLKEIYTDLKRILALAKNQQESNDSLIKKELIFTKKMINLIKPVDKQTTTYNSYGNIRK
ncbi:flagellar export chaperone FlgN [Clostridioides difficile]|uniref:flagellar protein FlgN n=1 Tax=Clostridioides difficile TaxID=1496 RepID=UPI000D1E9588|nr:flagellar protein FlgN [Clostridioides difficile]MCJ0056050.1 flagellar protein FlgN [Clostridioides difficile]MCU5872864.1 flagellar protein FlgN [Clostridioides difficile]MCU5899186.1 flagellar protein FlgN [Clostridioides difficile]MCW0824199.1 flagellar protein FlgN [Clostridioides difficile]MDL5066977.1 flagellar protein FlgN [Clostridioides difficile]